MRTEPDANTTTNHARRLFAMREQVYRRLRRVGLHTRFPWPASWPGRRAINLGAGRERVAGYESQDMRRVGDPPPDWVFDLNAAPWPLESGAYDVVVLRNVLEHCADTLAVMREVHRIARHGAEVLVRVPYWHSNTAFVDPTHVRFFAFETFDYFDDRTAIGARYDYYSGLRLRVRARWLNCFGWPVDSSNPALNAVLRRLAPVCGGVVHSILFFLRVVKSGATEDRH